MLKRTLFFFAYILFFLLIPICAYYFWPGNNLVADALHQEQEQTLGINAPTDSLNIANANGLQDQLNQFGGVMVKVGRFVHAGVAVLLCFPVSMLFMLAMALNKFYRPRLQTSGLINSITVFNLLYIPAFLILLLAKTSIFGMYMIIGLVAAMTKSFGLVLLIAIALVFLLTIIFNTLGARKGKRLEELETKKEIIPE